jgi:outer membrane protein OmpA-like peptidoglycan-associated protein
MANSNSVDTEIVEEKDDSEKDIVLNEENNDYEETNSKVANGLYAINEQGDLIFSFTEGISTEMNSEDIGIPSNLVDFKYKLFTYLTEHPDKELHIESVYSPKENLMDPNLGMRRGENIKSILVETGISNEKIVIKPVLKGINTDDSDWVNNCIQFAFKPLDDERIKLLRTTPKSKIMYPRYTNSGIMANTALKELVVEIQGYISYNPDLMVEVIGHTDNIGNGIDNYKMGLKYARQVRWYLINKGGFDPNQIAASSKGEEEPIESNKTSNGRTANRRIEIKFK